MDPDPGHLKIGTYSRRRNISALPAKVTRLPQEIILNSEDLETSSFR